MPRFALTATEQTLLGIALAREATVRGLPQNDALAAAANTTMAELRTLTQNQLNVMKGELQTAAADIDARAAEGKATLAAQIAAIDSALAKL